VSEPRKCRIMHCGWNDQTGQCNAPCMSRLAVELGQTQEQLRLKDNEIADLKRCRDQWQTTANKIRGERERRCETCAHWFRNEHTLRGYCQSDRVERALYDCGEISGAGCCITMTAEFGCIYWEPK
jgi:hypothetical protein